MQPDFDPSAAFSSEETTVVEWRRDQLVDADGKLLDTRPRLILHEVPFSLTVAEASLQEKVKRLSSVLNGVGDIIAKSLLRSLQSSPPALEGVLRRLMGKLAADEGLEQPPEFLEDEGPEGRTNLQTPPSIMDEVVKLAGEALESIDNVSVDSKLNAFGNLLNRVIDAKTFAQRICVVTDYIATLFYLAAALEDRGMACQLLHGGHRSVMLPLEPEVVLMATRSAVSEGLNLSEITDLVLYDVPDSSLALRKVLSRFDPLRRPSHLNVHALLPAGITDDLAAEHFRLLSESQA
jgi:hypothetical protein